MRESAAQDQQLPLGVFLQFELAIQMARTAEALIEIDGTLMTLLLARTAAATPAPPRETTPYTWPAPAQASDEDKKV